MWFVVLARVLLLVRAAGPLSVCFRVGTADCQGWVGFVCVCAVLTGLLGWVWGVSVVLSGTCILAFRRKLPLYLVAYL